MPRPAVHQRVRRVLVRTLLAAAILLIVALGVFLPLAGRYLVREDALQKSDVIVVLAGARVERWLEAVELYREGWAPMVVLSPGRVEDAELRLRRLGIRFPADVELAREAMMQMQVPPAAIETLNGSVDNTADEAAAAHQVAAAHHWTRVIVVTSKYHTRRAHFAFAREFDPSASIVMRGSRYDTSTPNRWWRRRADIRYVLSELEKLAAYKVGLGK